MHHSSARPADAIEKIINTYGNSLYRLCLVMLRNPSDAEDAVQETILKYLQKAPAFRDAAGEVVAEGESGEPAAVTDGGTVLTLPFEAAPGAYTLVIENFVGGSKADQPLPITGLWEYSFII